MANKPLKSLRTDGQISLEFLIILALVFALIASISAPLAHQARLYSEDVSKVSEVRMSLETISTAVDLTGANGIGARRAVRVHFPENVTVVLPFNRTKILSLRVTLGDGNKTTITKNTKYYIRGKLNVSKGWRNVKAECTLNNTGYPVVEITSTSA
ncbi:MAG: hypothetical protein HY929_05765 [Euryarchaeota archaeon]|nr:hypothetical protein [Euryarchaeota archaeon]